MDEHHHEEVAFSRLSAQARSLWGKSDYGEGEQWLPLYLHMVDSAYVARRLWDQWLPECTKRTIARSTFNNEPLAKSLFVFLAGVHDLGKATPVFQAKRTAWGIGEESSLAWKPERAGLPIPAELVGHTSPTHPIAGDVLLNKYLEGSGWNDHLGLASIIGSHHGNFPDSGKIVAARNSNVELYGTKSPDSPWRSVQQELANFAFAISGLTDFQPSLVHDLCVPLPISCLLTGLVIMTDWIASDQGIFPLVPLLGDDATDDPAWISQRERAAWEHFSLTPAWGEKNLQVEPYSEFFARRFNLPKGAVPRPVQVAAANIALKASDPGLMVIEAPMGEGKTEAALSAAEILAYRTGSGGVCVALPTMATTDAMFSRVESWLERLPHNDGLPEKSIYLAHGKAMLNEQFQGIVQSSNQRQYEDVGDDLDQASDGVVVSEWMFGRKRGMLANFCICTVDQVLMGALKMKHLPLRQLAIQNKVVIIDECHAYDIYMRQYLKTLLGWLGYWHVPVILLSATLPLAQRNEFFSAYLGGRKASGSNNSCNDRLTTSVSHSKPKKGMPAWKRQRAQQAFIKQQRGDASSKDGVGEVANLNSVPSSYITDLAAYPVITYSEGVEKKSLQTQPSGRKVSVRMRLMDDKLQSLADLLSQLLRDGGCAGVICDTVPRAQETASMLEETFGSDVVILDHSRYMDIDRMENENKLRVLLGPTATIANGLRPKLCIVVGTQVLEQSLDIDFDLLVTDIAPIDLVFQRLGRSHRHCRGNNESDRPACLGDAKCFVRGVCGWEGQMPQFARGIRQVYDEATLLESMATLGLTAPEAKTLETLPTDIPLQVRKAYSDEAAYAIPSGWKDLYSESCAKRATIQYGKIERSRTCRIIDIDPSIQANLKSWDLTEMANTDALPQNESQGPYDEDRGQLAVRDTQETIEVLLVRRMEEDEIALLPWVGSDEVPTGSEVPTYDEPDFETSQLLMQSAVRLPLSICPILRMDECITELEGRCARYVANWQESRWLSGRLLLVLEEAEPGVFQAELLGKTVRYTRRGGLATA